MTACTSFLSFSRVVINLRSRIYIYIYILGALHSFIYLLSSLHDDSLSPRLAPVEGLLYVLLWLCLSTLRIASASDSSCVAAPRTRVGDDAVPARPGGCDAGPGDCGPS
jgi:hypothetical protein